MGYSRKHVAKRLGHKDTSMLARYENGTSVPPHFTAMHLGVIYRIPSDFLYNSIYTKLTEIERAAEEAMSRTGQLVLF